MDIKTLATQYVMNHPVLAGILGIVTLTGATVVCTSVVNNASALIGKAFENGTSFSIGNDKVAFSLNQQLPSGAKLPRPLPVPSAEN